MTRPATWAELEETWVQADGIWGVVTAGDPPPKPHGPPWVRAELHLKQFKHLLAMKGLRVSPHHAVAGATKSSVPYKEGSR